MYSAPPTDGDENESENDVEAATVAEDGEPSPADD
jgi:hypothetical protein